MGTQTSKKRLVTASWILGAVVGLLTKNPYLGLGISFLGSIILDPTVLIILSRVWTGPNKIASLVYGIGIGNLIWLFVLVGLKFGEPWWYGTLWGTLYLLANPIAAAIQKGPAIFSWYEWTFLLFGIVGIATFLISTKGPFR